MDLGALENLFIKSDCKKTEPDILQPAEPFLNSAGESFRKSLFITQSNKGQTLCLRPEFTIPVFLSGGRGGGARREGKYYYSGKVFRQSSDARQGALQEFMQAGVESFGDKNEVKADGDIISLAQQSVKLLSDCEPLIVIGDPHFFKSLVTFLGISNTWRDRLLRAFGDETLIEKLLENMLKKPQEEPSNYDKDDFKTLKDKVQNLMIAHGVFNVGGRTPEDIASRYLNKRNEDVEINSTISNICKEFLNLECNNNEVAHVLESFCKKHNVNFSQALDRYEMRNEYLKNLGAPIRFSARFGRRLDYYSGFVFEIYDKNNPQNGPLAGGGRYDYLSEMLGNDPLPAVGFSLWLDRIGKA